MPTSWLHGVGPRVVALGIETSCDETAVAIVTSSREILGEAVHSQLQEQNLL